MLVKIVFLGMKKGEVCIKRLKIDGIKLGDLHLLAFIKKLRAYYFCLHSPLFFTVLVCSVSYGIKGVCFISHFVIYNSS